jgi:hypothetical protein
MSLTVKNDKYLNMRKKLDDLNIHFTFDISNFNLIESLLDKVTQLQQDSELKNMKYEKIKSEYEKNLLYVNSLVSENDKLVLENNDIHKKMMKFKNFNLKSLEAKELEISKLNIEKNELKLLNNRYMHKLETMEITLDSTRKKLSSILSKIYENNIGESSLRQMFENEIKLKPIINSSSNNTKTVDKQESLAFSTDYNLIVAKSNVKMNFSILDSVKDNKDTKNLMIDCINKTFNNNKAEQQVLIENLNNAFENELHALRNQNIRLKSNYEILYNKFNNILCSQSNKGEFHSSEDNYNLEKNINSFSSNKKPNQATNNNNIDENNQVDFQITNNDSTQKDFNNCKPSNSFSNQNIISKNYADAKEILFNDQKSEIIINYLKKEKENMEIKHRVQLNYLMEENKELKEKIKKMLKNSNLNRELKPWNTVKPESEISKKHIKEQMQKEINVLKNTILEQNEEIKSLKLSFHNYKENYISRSDVILNELKYKEVYEELKGAHQLIKVLEEKLKNSASINNSEKTIFNNNTIDLKAELDILKKNNLILNEKLSKSEDEYNKICDKYNTQVSISMRQSSQINELELKLGLNN